MKRKSTNHLSRIILFNSVLILIGVVCIELIFGSWISNNKIQQLNIITNAEYQLDVRDLYQTEKNPINYVRDRYGLRGHYKYPAEIDILTIGGSTTDQRYLDETQTWQSFIAENAQKEGRKLTIVNAGADGQSSLGHIRNFDLWFPLIPALKAKYILVYLGSNDFFVPDSSNYNDLSGNNTLKGLIKSKSSLYNLYQKIKGTYLASYKFPVSHRAIDFDNIDWTNAPLQTNHHELMAQHLISYEKRLKILNQKIRQFGAIPIFVTHPSQMYKIENQRILGFSDPIDFRGTPINGVDFYHMLIMLNKKTLEVCNKVNGICIDLAGELFFSESDFYDYFHNTPQGAKKIGTYLYNKLKENIKELAL